MSRLQTLTKYPAKMLVSTAFLAGIVFSGIVTADTCIHHPTLPSPSAINEAETQHNTGTDTELTPEGDVTIYSRQVSYQEQNYLKLDGDVEIVRGNVRVLSQSANIDQTTQRAELQGDIQVRGPEMVVQGEKALLNMESKETSVEKAEFTSTMTPIRGKAKRIHSPEQSKLNIEDGYFTTCQPDDEAWSFKSSDIRLDQETGMGVATHTRFNIYDVPVLYLPWFSFAIDDRRASGFLYPELGSANTGKGLYLTTPYYFNIAPHIDATLTPSLISGRGLHNELETRYLSRLGQTTLAAGYINKDDDFIGEEQDNGREHDGERWGLNLKQGIQFDTQLGTWFGRVDYSAVSDHDYLDDLNQGLQIENQDYLDKRASLSLNYNTWRFKALLQEYDILDDDSRPDDRPYQRLPELSLQANQHFSGWHLNWLSDYVYFYRDQDDLPDDEKGYGSRLHHRPVLSFPYEKPWGYITPSLSLDHTDYVLQSYSPEENHLSRTVAISELDSGLYFDQFTSIHETPYRISLEPRAYYVYNDANDQDDFPIFDSALPDYYFSRLFTASRIIGRDRIADENRYTLGLTTRLSDLQRGHDWGSFSMAFIHHLSNSSTDLDGLDAIERHNKQLAAELVLTPSPEIQISSSALWDKQRDEILETYTNLKFHDERYDYVVNVSHRYKDGGFGVDGIEQSDSSFITPLGEKMSLFGRWRYEFNQHRTIGTLAGVEYRSCCWRVQLLGQRYLNDESEIENGILFRFNLTGLGSYGENVSLLDDMIPGYAAREEFYH